MLPVDLWSVVASVLPHVRDPWPESIGLGFPFAVSGAFSMLADVFSAEVSAIERDRAVNRFGRLGFRLGLIGYAIALLNQVMFQL